MFELSETHGGPRRGGETKVGKTIIVAPAGRMNLRCSEIHVDSTG